MATCWNASWRWWEEGFLSIPIGVIAPRLLTLYRVSGGGSKEEGNPARPGVCFSFEKPRTRRDAEGLFSVWEWGNSTAFVTAFQVQPGTRLFVGKAHPGDFHQSSLGSPGSQVFIEAAEVRRGVRKLGVKTPLLDDMGSHVVVPNRDPGARRSS